MKTMVLGALLLSVGIVSGCGQGPCDRLSDICAKCPDASTKMSCNNAVASYKAVPVSGDAACQAAIDAKTFGSCM